MISRRDFLVAGGAGCLLLSSTRLIAQDALQVVAYEQGDPTARPEPAVFDPSFVNGLIDAPRAAGLNIPDPLTDFASALVAETTQFNGMDRWKDEKEVTDMLTLFGCPFKYSNGSYVAFCAAGIGYCAALAFAKATTQGTDTATLRAMLPFVDLFNYYPSPGVLNMSEVARGKSRWVDRGTTPQRGWLVVYDWSGSFDPLKTSHTGILISADKSSLRTFEFNTGSNDHPEGGAIGFKTRNRDQTVKGYINTSTKKIKSVPQAQ